MLCRRCFIGLKVKRECVLFLKGGALPLGVVVVLVVGVGLLLAVVGVGVPVLRVWHKLLQHLDCLSFCKNTMKSRQTQAAFEDNFRAKSRRVIGRVCLKEDDL